MTTAHPGHHDSGREASARPTPKEVLVSILKRAVLPALVAFGVLVAIGKIIMNVFDEIPAEDIEKERATVEAITREEGKPEQALPKIVEGRVNGFFKENVLLDQPFAKDSKKSVGKVLEEAGATATQFARFRVGS